MPLSDALVPHGFDRRREPKYPLTLVRCRDCTLVQILETVDPVVLYRQDYPYYSSFSDELVQNARRNVDSILSRRSLDSDSLVVELASNDGYLLQWFVDAGVPVLGIDPAQGPAAAAQELGIPTLNAFFDLELASRLVEEGRRADVIVGNNVLAHVPDQNEFVMAMSRLLAPDGTIVLEFPYVVDLIDHTEFDTIYHEHHCYFSCTAVDRLARRHDLFLNHVEYFGDLHGGTLRWHLEPTEAPSDAVTARLREEEEVGLTDFRYYADFAERVDTVRRDLLALLHDLRDRGASIAAYGAAAKGATLVNSVGIGTDLVDYVVDRNVHKQGKYMPGVHLPIRDPSVLLEEQPDYVLLLSWNFASEILAQQDEFVRRGGRFIVPVPTPRIVGS